MAGRIWEPVAGDKLTEFVSEEGDTHRSILHGEKRLALERGIIGAPSLELVEILPDELSLLEGGA